MQTPKPNLSGALFVLAGIAFIVAYAFSQQIAFIGVSAAFIGIGASLIARSRKASKS